MEHINYDGAEYIPICDAYTTQHGAPAVAAEVIEAYRADATPDDLGYVQLYELVYNIPDTDQDDGREYWDLIDWSRPDDIRESSRAWNLKTNSPYID